MRKKQESYMNRMNKDVINLIKDSASTFLNIAEMTQYRMKYLSEGNKEAKEKMYKHAFLAGAGISYLLTIGIAGLVDSCKSTDRHQPGSLPVRKNIACPL